MDSNTTLNPGNRLLITCVNMKYKINDWYSHLSISGIVVHGRCYICHYFYFSVTFFFFAIFYDCLLIDICFLFLFSCLLDSSLSSQESILTCLLSFWLILELYHFHMVLLHHIIVCYITKFYYSRLLYLIMSWLFI